MMDKEPKRTDVILELFRKRQGFTHETSTTLAEGVVETLNMIGQASFLADRSMSFGGEDFGIGLPEVGVQDSPLAIQWRKRVPQGTGSRISAGSNRAAHHQAGLDFQG